MLVIAMLWPALARADVPERVIVVGRVADGAWTDAPTEARLDQRAELAAVATELDERGMPAQPIANVRPGDLIRIDYGGTLRGHTPRAFDHVAALWEDRSDPTGPHKGAADGQLDGFDLVIHMGHPRLVIEPLANQSPATIDVLRWRQK